MPTRIETLLGLDAYDVEGRVIIAHFGRFAIANAYFPKGSGKDRDNSRVPYKLGFYRALFDRLQRLRRRGPVIVMGDYNTAHTELDLARPKSNAKTSGFLPEERAELDRWTDLGWSDTFRRQHPGEGGHSLGGANGATPAPTMSAGASTTCSPRPPPSGWSKTRSSGRP